MTYLFLGLVFLVVWVAAITDIRYGRVKNIHLIIALVIWLALIFVTTLSHHIIEQEWFAWLLNLGFSIVASIILYLYDIWSPGDCKLFLFIALSYPLEAYTVRMGNVFPSLDIIVFSFTLGYIFLLISTFIKPGKNSVPSAHPQQPLLLVRDRIISILANIGLLSSFYAVLDLYFGDFLYANEMFCALILIGLISLLQNRFEHACRILGFIGLLLFLSRMVINAAWIDMLFGVIRGLIISLIIDILNQRIGKNTYREIPGEEVNPGMILSYVTIWDMQNCIDPDLPHTTTENRRSRITQRQADAVRLWCKNAKRNVIIVEMIPFAPCIALAVCVLIIRFFILKR